MTTLDPQVPPINDCWNNIGIQGDRSCAELAERVHCRNCPMYTDAAIRILEARPVELHSVLRASAPPVRSPGSSRIVTFRLGAEYLALPAASIEEVACASTIHTLPHRNSRRPIGLVNVRGELLLFVDLAALLAIDVSAPSMENTQGHHIVFGHAGSRFVFRTDEICDVVSFRREDLNPVPTTHCSASFTMGVLRKAGRLIACLAPERLVEALKREVA
jgi:chemotaxis signal transduction protein